MRGRLTSMACIDHRPQVERFHLKVDLALADARDVDQVVHQPGQLLNLTIDHIRELLELGIGPAFDAEDLNGVTDRGERVAQLMPQHRQELILAAVCFLDGVQPAPLGTCRCRDRLATILARPGSLQIKLRWGHRSLVHFRGRT